jgi:signal transduction histidine kinase
MYNLLDKIPWQKKLYIFASIITIIPSLFISYNIINIAKEELTSSTNGELILTANQLAYQLNGFYVSVFENLRMIKNGLENENLGQREKLSFLLAGIKNVNNLLAISIVFDDSGKFINAVEARKDSINNISHTLLQNSPEIFSFDSMQVRDVINEKLDLSQPKYFPKVNLWVSMAVIEIDLGYNLKSYLLAKVNLSEFYSSLSTHLFNKTGKIAVIDKNNNNLFNLSGDLSDYGFVNDISNLLRSGTRLSGLNSFENQKGEKYVACIAFPQNLDWAILAIIDEHEAYTPVDEMLLVLRYWLIIGLVVALFGVLLFSKNISKPILKMSQIANKIASGSFDVKVGYRVNDSIGILGTSLEKMGSSLKSSFKKIEQQNIELEEYSKTLEQKVDDRTKQLKKSNEDLQQAYLKVLELNEEKNEFLGIAAHDLKNPLIAVKGYGEMLFEDDELPADLRQEFAKSIVESSERMFNIIKTLLDVNAIEEGKIKINPENVDYRMILDNVVSMYQERAANKSIEIINNSEKDDYYIYADMNILVQVLENIISNAIKFSPKNKRLFTKVFRKDQFVCCSVKDEGPGFSEEDKKKLFGKFAKLSARPTAGEHSSGLGLSIVKKLVELMNGNIYVISEQGKGAEFIVEFPGTDTPDFI